MITISLPRDMIINANVSYHRQVRATKARELRNMAYWIAKAAKETYDGPVDLAITIAWPPLERRRDRLNLAGTIKHLVDGMVDAGVLPDDNDKIIRSEHLSTAYQPCKDAYAAVLSFHFQPIEAT